MKIRILAVSFLFLLSFYARSQCEVANNRYFAAGENLSYDLYFKYGILFSKAGNASIKTESIKHQGNNAYKMSLTSHSTGLARKAFPLDDTLSCIMDSSLRPLAYFKDAHEGNEHTIEKQTYTYLSGNNIKIHAVRIKNGEERYNVTFTTNNCTYDMMSIVFFARTLNYDAMKKGSKTSVVFISGQKKMNMQINYEGTTSVKANNGVSYNCHKLTLTIEDPAFPNPQEAMKVLITNDLNRMPVQIESKLKIGSTKAILKGFSGLKNAVGSR